MVLLLQLSLRRGTLAAFIAAGGIWLSDALLAFATYYGIGSVEALADSHDFRLAVGSIGSIILVVSAAVMWFRDPPDLDAEREIPGRRGMFAAFFQGFGINLFNPFTVTFWTLFSVSQIHDRQLGEPAAWAVLGGLLGTIVFTDTLKVLAARKVREFLQPAVIRRVQRFGALALAVFGIVLGLRVWLG